MIDPTLAALVAAEAEGMLRFLQKHEPALAMMILSRLCVIALIEATPHGIGNLEKSAELFLTGVVGQLQRSH